MPYREINSKLIIDLNVNYKAINFLEGDMEEMENSKTRYNTQKTNGIMADVNLTLSVITLNENLLNSPVNRQRLTDYIQKHDPTILCLQETHFRFKDTNML